MNLAATDPEYEKRTRQAKYRPASAPYTRSETEAALLSAGETDKIVEQREAKKTRPETCKPRILQQIQQEREERELSGNRHDSGGGDGPTNNHNKNTKHLLLDALDTSKS